jgi:predicted acyl esterase
VAISLRIGLGEKKNYATAPLKTFWRAQPSPHPETANRSIKVVVEKHLALRTRDDVSLYADVYRPDTSGKFPALVVRTPYDKCAEMALTEKDFFSAVRLRRGGPGHSWPLASRPK